MPTERVRSPQQLSPYEMTTEQIEQALLEDRAGQMRPYFGDALYEELRELTRRTVQRAALRVPGPRLLILPGIMGSQLGTPRRFFFNDVIWFNPLTLAQGRATELAFGGRRVRHEALDVVPYFYYYLRKRMQAQGYDVAYHYYDWRYKLTDLGEQLAERLANEPKGVILVCHSMGGLVARAALAHDAAERVGCVVQLGTPNRGSFNAVQVLRGVYSMSRTVDRIDLFHNIDELTEDVFNTLPSVYELLPHPGVFTSLDLFDRATWPERPAIDPGLLTAAGRDLAGLPPPDSRFALVAGYNQETITDLSKDDDGEFVYHFSTAGDGTVPLAFAQLPGLRTEFVVEEHGSLPNNSTVAEKTHELIQEILALPRGARRTRAATAEAAPAPPAVPVGPTRAVSDGELREVAAFGGRGGPALSDDDRRAAIRSLFRPAPTEAALEGPGGGMVAGVAAAPDAAAAAPLRGVLVGRRRQRRLELRLAHGNLLDVEASAYVLGVFPNVKPVGPALEIDAELNGAISELFNRRMFDAGAGQIYTLPARGLKADVVVLAGLGDYDQSGAKVQQLVAGNVVRVLTRARLTDFATVPFGGNSVEHVGRTLESLLKGFLQGLRDVDGSDRFQRVVLAEIDDERYRQMRDRLYQLAATPLFDDFEVTLDEIELPPAARRAGVARPGTVVGPRNYLHVRGQAGSVRLEVMLLTAGGKATVIPGVAVFEESALTQLVESIQGDPPKPIANKVGKELTRLVVPDSVRALLERPEFRDLHLVVVHDAPASKVPWEALQFGDGFPCLLGGVSRRYIAPQMPVAKWLEQRRRQPALEVLLIVNPTEDLEGAEKEGRRVEELFGRVAEMRVTPVRGPEATRERLLREFQSGKYDVIHYAGHAAFNPRDPGESGIVCADEDLTGNELAALGNLPALVVFNACEAARVRRRGRRRTPPPPKTRTEGLDRTASFAERFLYGGVAQFVGTYWPVGDAAAAAFAEAFYRDLLAGKAVGAALTAARGAVQKKSKIDWANYIHYGDPDYVLKQPSARSETVTVIAAGAAGGGNT